MAFQHGKSSVVLMGIYDISAYTDNADVPLSLDTAETTAFGKSAKTFIPGLRDATASLGGTADYATGAIDDVLAGAISGGQQVFSLFYGGSTIGNRARVGVIRETSYQQSAPVGDKITWSADLQADNGIDGNAVSLHALGAETGTVNSASVDNSAASTNGYAVNLHVTAATVTTVTIKVQHSTDNSTWADLATFTAVTTTTSEQLTGTGTVNRYVRCIISAFTGTTVTYAVAFARR